MSDDARQHERTDTMKGAIIVSGPDKVRHNCLVSNISPDGAELTLESDQRLPQHFTVEIPHEGKTYRAAVRWREEGRVGVEFLATESRTTPHLKIAS